MAAATYYVSGERILTDDRKASLRQQFAAGVPEALEVVRLARMPVGSIYDDTGIHSLLAAYMTGEDAFFADAVTRFVPRGSYHQTDRNNTRQYATLFAQMYSWLRDWMTQDQRDAVLDGLLWNADFMLGLVNSPVENGGTRLSDSDETSCHCLGLINAAKAVEADRPDASAAIFTKGAVTVAQMVDTLRRFCTVLAKGGEWMESTSYNPNTCQLIAQGTVGAGIELYPEFAQFLAEAADLFPWHFTSEAKGWDILRWGTIYYPTDIEMKSLWGWTAILGAITNSPVVLGMFAKYRTRYASQDAMFGDAKYSMWRGFLFLDHSLIHVAPPADTAFGVKVAEGVGLTVCRSPETLVYTQSCPPLGVDHPVYGLADVLVWFNGEWALNHGMGDDPHPFDANNALLSNASMSPLVRGRASSEALPNGGFRTVASAKGTLTPPNYYQPPVPYVDSWQRETVWDGTNTLTITDTFAFLLDPLIDPRVDHYTGLRASLPTEMRARQGMAQSQIHCPPNPTPIRDGWQWTTPKGTNVVVTCSGYTRMSVQPGHVYPDQFSRLVFAADGMASKLIVTVRFGVPLEPAEEHPAYSAAPIPDPSSPPLPPPPPPPPSPPVVPPVVIPPSTPNIGNWIGVHGADGFALANVPGASLTVTPTGASLYTWAAATTDVRAIQKPDGSGYQATCWYSPTGFSLSLTIPNPGTLWLYCVDWDNIGRAQTVDVIGPDGAVIKSFTVASFAGGVWLSCDVPAGAVAVKATNTATSIAKANAVISGLFLDAPPPPPVVPPAPVWVEKSRFVVGGDDTERLSIVREVKE